MPVSQSLISDVCLNAPWNRKYVPRNSGNNGGMIYNLHVLGHFLMVIHNAYIA